MFRNCGLPGEFHICWDVSWDLGGTGWDAKPWGALPLLAVSWATVPWPEHEVGSENLSLQPPQGTMWGCSLCLWDQPLADMCPLTPEVGQQVCGAQESRCPRGSCLAQHRFCDGTDDCGDSSDEDAVQCGEHPWAPGGVLWMG